jgi:ParB family chromosome partitioning protein
MSGMEKRRRSLGRGLSSLIPNTAPLSTRVEEETSKKSVAELDVESILPGDGQPRQIFESEAIQELASSIKEHGILQPILVRKRYQGQYEIIAGERRWRAAQAAGLHSVPCLIAEMADEKVLTAALVENIQRRDLNPIEEAEAYRRLAEDLGYTQAEVADAVGKKRSSIANSLRLLKLPIQVRELVLDNTLSMGHARALLSLDDEASIEKLSKQVIHRNLSVRKTEDLVKKFKGPKDENEGKTSKTSSSEPRAIKELRLRLERSLGTKVKVDDNGESGKITIHYSTRESLNDIIEKIDSIY